MPFEPNIPPALPHAPRRIVSLVPAITESLFDLGLGSRVVAISEACLYPAEALSDVPRLPRAASADLTAITALEPELVFFDAETSRAAGVAALAAQSVPVWVVAPQTVRETLDMLWNIIRLLDHPLAGQPLAALETTLEWTAGAVSAAPLVPVFCPLGREPVAGAIERWLTPGAETYVSDLLAVCGGRNIFADLTAAPSSGNGSSGSALTPGGAARYLRVTMAEAIARNPQVVLIASGPAGFGTDTEQRAFDVYADLPAVKDGRVHLLDGTLLTWPGTRLARALQEIPPLLQTESQSAD